MCVGYVNLVQRSLTRCAKMDVPYGRLSWISCFDGFLMDVDSTPRAYPTQICQTNILVPNHLMQVSYIYRMSQADAPDGCPHPRNTPIWGSKVHMDIIRWSCVLGWTPRTNARVPEGGRTLMQDCDRPFHIPTESNGSGSSGDNSLTSAPCESQRASERGDRS